MGILERKREVKDHSLTFGLSHHPDGLPSIELRVGISFWSVKDKMHDN